MLAWLKWNYTRFDKSYIIATLNSFFHEDEMELVEAKNEFINVVTSTAVKIDGWSKCVNNKGASINCHRNKECSKQQLHTEDLILIFQVIDDAKVALPSYAAVDYSRIPPAPFQLINQLCQCASSQVSCSDASTTQNAALTKMTETLVAVQQIVFGREEDGKCPVCAAIDFYSGQANRTYDIQRASC